MSEPTQFNTEVLRGALRHDEPMSRHVSWRAGGVAQRVYQPADLSDLQTFLRQIPADEPLLAVGLGSNMLVRDGGYRGTVLLMVGALTELHLRRGGAEPSGACGSGFNPTAQSRAEARPTVGNVSEVRKEEGLIYAQAGVAGAKLARFAASNDLCGAEFFVGIPGTLGGMLAMNAGCYGGETWGVVQRVQVLTRSGELLERTPQEYDIGYRHVALKQHSEEFFVGAWLRFGAGDVEAAKREIKALMAKRSASQPLQLPNCGSVFRNPQGKHAAKLIEDCGLKGKRIGGAQVSEKHANFIVNTGGATAADIEALIVEVQAAVQKQTGINLHTEVKIVGERVK